VVGKGLVLLALLVQELEEGLLEPLVYVVVEHVLVQAAWAVEVVERKALEAAALLVWDILALERAGVVRDRLVVVVWDMALLNAVRLFVQGVLLTYLYHNEHKIVLDLN
jgi:hypothetical protein